MVRQYPPSVQEMIRCRRNLLAALGAVGLLATNLARANTSDQVARLAGDKAQDKTAEHASQKPVPPSSQRARKTGLGQILEERVPGGLAVLGLGSTSGEAPLASYRGSSVLVIPDVQNGDKRSWLALVGLGLDSVPGPAKLEVEGGTAIEFKILPKAYSEQRLKVAPSMVDLSAQDLARYEREKAHISALIAKPGADLPVTLQMLVPTVGRQSSSFGLRRVFNGVARNPHSGMDIAASTGTPFVAPLAATVIDVGDYFFNGKTVWLDHGSGLLSMMCHLSQSYVQVGDRLKQGEKVGEVGATGRVTGPHLHWSVSLNRQMVNPALFLKQAQA
jgi:murein DD-endopeptidase MepM/ murein hydrolase activator NlpD